MNATRFPDAASLRCFFSEQHVDWILRQPHPAETAHCRAVGAWDANMLEHLDAYTQLERLIRAGVVKP